MNRKQMNLVGMVLVVFACSPMTLVAAGSWDIGVVGESMSGDLQIGTVPGFGPVTLDYETLLFGAEFGTMVGESDHWRFSMTLLYGAMDYEVLGVAVPDSALETAMFLVDHNISYHFGSAAIKPVVTAGVGYGTVIHDSAASAAFESNFDFTYNLGAGAIWDINNSLSLKGLYKIRKIDDADVDFDLDGFSIALLYSTN